MQPRWSDLWRLSGPLNGPTFAFWGITLAILKYALDWSACRLLTGKSFAPQHYYQPGALFGLIADTSETPAVLLVLAAVTLPFIWTGIALTLRRLRDAGLPAGLLVLFFLPVLNLILFFLLSVFATREDGPGASATVREGRPIGRFGAAAIATFVSVGVVLVLTGAATIGLGSYGWGVFVGLPFLLGFLATTLYGWWEPRSFTESLMVSLLSCGIAGGMLVVSAIEGILCVLMAAPIGLGLALIGTIVGYVIQEARHNARRRLKRAAWMILVVPGLTGFEHAAPRSVPLHEVRTSIDIAAPPEVVWRHVVGFSELPPPTEWWFHTGIAYPVRAELKGSGLGAVRHCVFSTGPFVEPITVWDEPRRLGFDVVEQPCAMRELSPWNIHPPHVDDYLRSRRGEFLLESIPGGGTRLTGMTWYEHRIEPQFYWRLWSDPLIQSIHRRVLRHVKDLSERVR